MRDWELYSEIDEKGRFPKKIQKENEEYQKQFEKEYEELYWKEAEREAREFNEFVAQNYGSEIEDWHL